MRPFLSLSSASLLLTCLPAQEPTDAPDKTPSDFARFVTIGEGGHFDTAITSYRNGDGVTVALIGAVHIADQRYFDELNDRFTRYEVLLYELVAEADSRPQKGQDRGAGNPIAMLQHGLKNSMELSFQLDGVDYSPANFVHADMTPTEFQESMQERGESLLTIMWRMMMEGQRVAKEQADAAADAVEDGKTQPGPNLDLVKAFRTGEGRHTLRMLFASQLEQMENMSAGLSGSDGKGSTLLEGRNEKCLKVMQEQIKAGRRNLGIYYGAAHLPHMEKRLLEMGFHKTGHEWLVAWDCTPRPDKKYDRALMKLRSRCREELGELIVAAAKFRRAQDAREVPTVPALAATKRDGVAWYPGPVQDPWGRDYELRKRQVGLRWEAVSAGPDGQIGTDDDLVATEPRGVAGGIGARADAPAVDPKVLTARTDAQVLRSATRRWLQKRGDSVLPTVVDLHGKTDDGHPWASQLERDPWGREWRVGWLERPEFEVRSGGPDGEFGNADDVVSTMDRRTEARETAALIREVAKLWRGRENQDPTLAALLAARHDGRPILDHDGKDPWGQDYLVRVVRGRLEVVSAGADRAIDTGDDIVAR